MRAITSDPPKKKPSYNDLVNLILQEAVAESTATPNYAEQAFLNQQNSLPTLNPSRYRDQGAITEGNFEVDEDGKIIPDETMSVVDVLSEPMKALDYYQYESNREGGLPTRAEFDAFKSGNAYDMALATLNPAAAFQAILDDPMAGVASVTPIGRVGQVFKNAGINNVDEAVKVINDVRFGNGVSQYGEDVVDAAQTVIDAGKNASRFYDDAIPQGIPMQGHNGSEYYLQRLSDYALAEAPEFAQNYNINMLNSDEAADIARKFGEDYLTSYRAVKAQNPEQAAEYMTSPYGGGDRISGLGIYTTNDPMSVAGRYGNYVGRLQAQPLNPGNARNTMGQLYDMVTRGQALRPSYSQFMPADFRQKLADILKKEGYMDPHGYMENQFAKGLAASRSQRGALSDGLSVRVIRGTGEDRVPPILQNLVESQNAASIGGTPRWGTSQVSPGEAGSDFSRYSPYNRGVYLTGEEQLMLNQGLKPGKLNPYQRENP